jgi:hypothetical protein
MLLFGYKHETKSRLEADSVTMLTAKAPSKVEDLTGAGETEKTPAAAQSQPTVIKGAYIVVYGEPEEEREQSNLARAEKCFQSLKDVLTGMGANIDALIPIEAFEEPVLNDAEISAALDAAALSSVGVPSDVATAAASASSSSVAGASSHSVAVGGDDPMGGYMGDHMTDEEFARYLQNMD